jgi:hypothetical protein
MVRLEGLKLEISDSKFEISVLKAFPSRRFSRGSAGTEV